MSSIVKNYIYNIIYQTLVLFIPIFLSPYLAKTLGAEKLGIYGYIFSICNIISTIGLIGTYNYGIRQIAYNRENHSQRQNVFWEIFWVRITLGLICLAVYIIISLYSRYYTEFFLFIGWLIATIIDPSWLFIGVEDMKPTILKNFYIKISSVICIFLLVKDSDDLNTYISIMSISILLSTVILFFQLSQYIKEIRFTLNKFKEHIKESFYLFLPQVATILYLQMGKIMIEHVGHDTKSIAFYDMGEKIVTIPLTFITVLSTVMMPRIANRFINNDKESIIKLLNKAGQFSLMLAIPLSLGIAICAKNMVPWFLGNEFEPTISIIIAISPIIIMNSLLGISGNQYFTATNQTKVLIKSYFTALFINIILNYILISQFGGIGAAYTISITTTVSVLIQYYYLNKQVGVKIFLNIFLRYFIISVPMSIIIFIIGKHLSPNYKTTIIQILTGIFIYIITLLLAKDEIIKEVIFKLKNRIK